MSGNVWEWVEDCWYETHEGAPKDGRAWLDSKGDCTETERERVLRGGSWSGSPDFAVLSNRASSSLSPPVRTTPWVFVSLVTLNNPLLLGTHGARPYTASWANRPRRRACATLTPTATEPPTISLGRPRTCLCKVCERYDLRRNRCLAGKRKVGVTLSSRRGNLFTAQFPHIAVACERLPADTLLDGEIVTVALRVRK